MNAAAADRLSGEARSTLRRIEGELGVGEEHEEGPLAATDRTVAAGG